MIPKTLLNPPTGVLPFDMFHSFGPMLDKQAWTPPYDIYETDREIVLKVELPEMHNEDVRVTLENGVLTLRGERKFKETANREHYHRIERKYGRVHENIQSCRHSSRATKSLPNSRRGCSL